MTKLDNLIKALTENDVQKMKDYIIISTIREVDLDPTERLNELTNDEIKKEYQNIINLSFWD